MTYCSCDGMNSMVGVVYCEEEKGATEIGGTKRVKLAIAEGKE